MKKNKHFNVFEREYSSITILGMYSITTIVKINNQFQIRIRIVKITILQ